MSDNVGYYGFRWVESRTGSGIGVVHRFPVASAYQASPGGVNVDLNVGDPVKKVNDGTVALCAATDAWFGVVAGIAPYFDGSKMVKGKSLPGGTTYGSVLERSSYVFIWLAADNIFEAVCDDAVTFTTEATYRAAIGENVNLSINQVSGSTLASPKIDISDRETGAATKPLRIVGLSYRINTDYTGANVPLLVTGNLVQQAPFQTTSV